MRRPTRPRRSGARAALARLPGGGGDEEFEDLSDLAVPSWAELVASLYRPPDR
ncbi:MAG: hypothetical protein U0797_06725 [Gemmataceae bacterium]